LLRLSAFAQLVQRAASGQIHRQTSAAWPHRHEQRKVVKYNHLVANMEILTDPASTNLNQAA